MTLHDGSFVIPWRARYYEVDQQGVVFNAWYLAWFDEAISAFMTAAGLDSATLRAHGIEFQLVHSEIDWRSGVRSGEDVELVVRPDRIGTTSFDVRYAVRRGDEEICSGRIVYVSIARDGSGKRPVPDMLRAVLSRGRSAMNGAARGAVAPWSQAASTRPGP